MSCIEFLEEYKGNNINKDNTIKKFKVYAIMPRVKGKPIFYNHLSGSSVEILKRKIDKFMLKEGLKC